MPSLRRSHSESEQSSSTCRQDDADRRSTPPAAARKWCPQNANAADSRDPVAPPGSSGHLAAAAAESQASWSSPTALSDACSAANSQMAAEASYAADTQTAARSTQRPEPCDHESSHSASTHGGASSHRGSGSTARRRALRLQRSDTSATSDTTTTTASSSAAPPQARTPPSPATGATDSLAGQARDWVESAAYSPVPDQRTIRGSPPTITTTTTDHHKGCSVADACTHQHSLHTGGGRRLGQSESVPAEDNQRRRRLC